MPLGFTYCLLELMFSFWDSKVLDMKSCTELSELFL